jgi:hypothetical protein
LDLLKVDKFIIERIKWTINKGKTAHIQNSRCPLESAFLGKNGFEQKSLFPCLFRVPSIEVEHMNGRKKAYPFTIARKAIGYGISYYVSTRQRADELKN